MLQVPDIYPVKTRTLFTFSFTVYLIQPMCGYLKASPVLHS